MDQKLVRKDQAKEAMEVAEEARDFAYRHPSFGGKLFMGEFDPTLVYPFPEQDTTDKLLGDDWCDKVEKLLLEHLDPEAADKSRELPKSLIEAMAKMGLFAMKVPKEYGGLGLSQTNYNRVVQKVASYCGSTTTLLSAHQSIGVPQPLKFYGTEAQKKKYFPRFRQGSISAFALTEPGVGSDPAQMKTEAVLSPDGTHYILNGEKLWCTNGTIADIIIVIAKTAPKIVNGKEKQQITAFILEMNRPGVEVVHRCEFMGLNAIYNGLLSFKNVKIPVEDRLGDEGRGLAMALDTINVGRLTLPAASLGGAKQMLSIARRWGTDRIQWGMPVGLHEQGRDKLAWIASTTFAIEAIDHLTSGWQDIGGRDIRIEAAMSKMFCTEAFWKITDMTMQFRGGRGYETARSLRARGEAPYPVERAMRDCRVNMILEGSTEIMKLFLTREALDPHFKRLMPILKGKKGIGYAIGQGFHYLGWYTKQLFKPLWNRSYKKLGRLGKYFTFIEKTSPRMARTLFYYMVRYGQKLEYKQLLLGRLIEIGTDLFAMSAVVSYAKHLNTDAAEELADYFCRLAKRRIEENFEALTDNEDPTLGKIGKNTVEGNYRWLEEGIIWIGPEI